MTIALDAGAFHLRSLRQGGGRLIARRCRAIAAFVDDNEARRRWLKAANVPHLVAETSLVIPGDAAVEAAGLCDIVPEELLPAGELPADEAVTRQVIAALVDGLVPRALQRGAVCCFSHPAHDGSPCASQAGDDQRLEFFTQLVRLRGYSALPLNPATALVLAELSRFRFTGLGVACGASGCDLAVVHRGNQIACARLERGGHWIDEQIARRVGITRLDADGEDVLDLGEARQQKELASLSSAGDTVSRIVSELYDDLLNELADTLNCLLDSDPRISTLRTLPVVCGGGPARCAGFGNALESILGRCESRVELGTPQFVSDAEYAVARGCLIRAEIEERATPTEESESGNTGHKSRSGHSSTPALSRA